MTDNCRVSNLHVAAKKGIHPVPAMVDHCDADAGAALFSPSYEWSVAQLSDHKIRQGGEVQDGQVPKLSFQLTLLQSDQSHIFNRVSTSGSGMVRPCSFPASERGWHDGHAAVPRVTE
jgi:hypothetical protein